ncbi:MAG: ROK family protein [Syntrophomonadaceae bacterium]|jgi:glucokinase|nr:ROK family protein [Syntrophomonadaceae bacterium]
MRLGRGWMAGIDLGGTKILTGLADADGRLVAEVEVATCAEQGSAAVVGRMAETVKQLLEQVGAEEEELAGMVAASPGPLNPVTGVVYYPPNLGWCEFPLREALADIFPVPIEIENDASLAALAEYRYGYGGRYDPLLYMTVSTGVGGGIVIDGSIYHGAGGAAGEFGHMKLLPDGPLCGCGCRGCLETLASGTAMARQARELAERGQGKRMLELAGNCPEEITARTVGEVARGGDAEAGEIILRTGRWLGIGLANLVNIFDPAAIVLGGGAALGLGALLLDPAREEMKRQVMRGLGKKTEILPAKLGGRSGLLGCLALAEQKEWIKSGGVVVGN